MTGRASRVFFWRGESSSAQRVVALAAGLLAVLATGLAWPSSGAGSSDPVSSDPVFKGLMVDGRTVSGRIVALGPRAIRLASAEGAEHELPIDRLVKLNREIAASLAPLDRAQVILPEGDCVKRVVVGSSSDTSLDVQSDALGKLAIPLDCLLGLIMAPPGQTDPLDELWDRVRREPRKTEVVWLTNGDQLTGGFLGLNDRKLKIQVAGKPVDIDRPGVLAVGFDPTLVKYPRPRSDFLELTLKDGTRLGVEGARIAEGSVQATTRFGQSIRFPFSELVSVHARSRSVVFLSERKPARSVYVPYVGPTRDYQVDRTVDGHLFQLAGQTYDRGIGVQSRTLLAYEIAPGDRRFQALVGVDERAGPLGSVIFRVLVDNEERFKTPPLADRDAPRSIDVDLSGGKFLILVTEFGDRGDVRDLADWVEARLIRSVE
jgi:hypothetical protein